MLSSPRFDPKSHRPDGCTCTSAAVLVPVKVAGIVETVWTIDSVPCAGSSDSALMVLPVSSTRYAIAALG